MRKTLLLLSAAMLAAGFVNGQSLIKKGHTANDAKTAQAVFTIDGVNRTVTAKQYSNSAAGVVQATPVGHKTTSGGGRWYDYIASILQPNVTALDFTGLDIWYDTSSYWGYTGTTSPYDQNTFTSTGLGFDPMFSSWNNATDFPGEIAVSSFDAYTIDSVQVLGWYNRNYTKPLVNTYIDTLILTFVFGNGDSTTDLRRLRFTNATLLGWYGIPSTGSLDFFGMLFDSSNHRAGKISGTTVVPVTSASAVYKFLLYPGDTNNSNSGRGTQYPRVSRPSGAPLDPVISFSVAPGNTASMSVTFRSGDPTYPTFPTPDTVRMSDGTAVTGFKYGGFREVMGFSATSSSGGSANFPPYNPADHTSGYTKKEGSGGWNARYIPNWAWSSLSGGASSLQYPYITYHIQCTTCPLTSDPSLAVNDVTDLNNIIVAPNPADNSLNVSFPLATGSKAIISLTNMIGQVVLQQATTTGRSAISTASLPAGMYVLTIESGGARTTHRVVVAH